MEHTGHTRKYRGDYRGVQLGRFLSLFSQIVAGYLQSRIHFKAAPANQKEIGGAPAQITRAVCQIKKGPA